MPSLAELAAADPQARPLAVPEWTLGCFHRRCITYATGAEDTRTRVVWIQSHGLTGDIRVPARRPDVSGRNGLAGCTVEELIALAEVEGGVADTAWAHGLMRWENWTAFQPYDKWPEPGRLERVGACLVEFAPSGIYVEDWRAQPGGEGLLVGLRLVGETAPDGRSTPREGGLVIAGGHAILSLGRRSPLPAEAPVHRQLAAADDPRALATAAFDSFTAYAVEGADGGFRVELSTDPFAQGEALRLGDFVAGGDGLLETLPDGSRRSWRIDTLLPEGRATLATACAAQGEDWLEREAGTLLRP